MVVQTILMDMEFDKTINELTKQTVINIYATKEHVADITRCIHTVKELSYAIVSILPFQYLHQMIVTNIVYFSVLPMNALPAKN